MLLIMVDLQANERVRLNLGVHPVGDSLADGLETPERGTVSDVGCKGNNMLVRLLYLYSLLLKRGWGWQRLTLRVGGEGGQQPIHVGLGQRAGGLDEEVRQEAPGVERVLPVDLTRVVDVKLHLHDDGPDVHAEVEHDHRIKAELRPPPLANALEIQDEAEAETSHATHFL